MCARSHARSERKTPASVIFHFSGLIIMRSPAGSFLLLCVCVLLLSFHSTLAGMFYAQRGMRRNRNYARPWATWRRDGTSARVYAGLAAWRRTEKLFSACCAQRVRYGVRTCVHRGCLVVCVLACCGRFVVSVCACGRRFGPSATRNARRSPLTAVRAIEIVSYLCMCDGILAGLI